ncbi:MAG: ABC transporter substrate-binding protein [Thermoanaerobaculia bacterium]
MISLLVGLTAAFALAACRKESSVPPPPKPLTAKLATFRHIQSALPVAAIQSNTIEPGTDCIAKGGLQLTLVPRTQGPDIIDALSSNSVEFGTLAVTPTVLQALQGHDLTIFATISTTDHDIKLVARKAAGVTSGDALRGKNVGYASGTYGEIYLDRYLQKHHILRSEVHLVSAAPPQLRDLVVSGGLDAAVLWEPFVNDLLTDSAMRDTPLFVDADPSIYVGRISLVAKPAVLAAHRGEAEALVREMICAENVMHANPDGARHGLEKWLDRKPDSLRGLIELKTFHVDLDVPALSANLKDEAAWAAKAVFSGRVSTPSNLDRLIDSSVLESVDKNRVRH